MKTTLATLTLGAQARIVSVEAEKSLKERLYDLGLTPGCRVRCLFCAPSGDPRAYLVRGTMLAIRNRDAAKVEVDLWD